MNEKKDWIINLLLCFKEHIIGLNPFSLMLDRSHYIFLFVSEFKFPLISEFLPIIYALNEIRIIIQYAICCETERRIFQ